MAGQVQMLCALLAANSWLATPFTDKSWFFGGLFAKSVAIVYDNHSHLQ
jgi:hypothetical protein